MKQASVSYIVNALTLAARQYEIDAEHASELALHGMTIFEPAEALAGQFRQVLNRCPRTTRQNHVSMGRRACLRNKPFCIVQD
jgi:hypothetical protein